MFRQQNYRHPHPAYVGDTLTATIEVVAVKPDKLVVQIKVDVRRPDGQSALDGDA